MIGIINYHGGNAPSVAAAFTQIGAKHRLIDNAADLHAASAIVLPGVGAARATIESLRNLDLVSPLEDFVLQQKKPFLGICVGLQVLFEHSEEDDCDCLGWLAGTVHRFDDKTVRVPQIGWNELAIAQADHPVVAGVPADAYCYFVNSYHAKPADGSVLIATTDYDGSSTAMVAKDNIWASQFHMEKSGPVGLKMLQNFVAYAMPADGPDPAQPKTAHAEASLC